MLSIYKTIEDGKVLFELSGQLDAATSPMLQNAFQEVQADLDELTLDCRKLNYISSAGLRILLLIHKSLNLPEQMKLTHVSEDVMELFDVTGFSDILSIE